MNIRYAFSASWDSGYNDLYNLRLSKTLQEGSYLWEQSYDRTRADRADIQRSSDGSFRLSSPL